MSKTDFIQCTTCLLICFWLFCLQDLRKPFDKASKDYDAKSYVIDLPIFCHLLNFLVLMKICKFLFSAKLEKEKKQHAKESGVLRTEIAPQEVILNNTNILLYLNSDLSIADYLIIVVIFSDVFANFTLEIIGIQSALMHSTLWKNFIDSRRDGEREALLSVTDVRGDSLFSVDNLQI